jgi:hypothetical protein
VPQSEDARRDGAPVYTIIVHTSPPSDAGFPHWTEAPECPAAHEGGRTADEAVTLTMERIKAWRACHGAPGDEAVEFRIEHAR